uniref:Phospholipase A2 n=1 Tax=Steinernema glaseri TaxID=37863 RepID=A0A1I7ZY88_9BILA
MVLLGLRLLLLLTVFVSASAFTCGSGRFQNVVANIFISLDCKSKLGKFDSCCKTHDRCYDRQRGRSKCDNAFCSCLAKAAKGSWACEKVDSPAFCQAVKKFGDKAYKNAGK